MPNRHVYRVRLCPCTSNLCNIRNIINDIQHYILTGEIELRLGIIDYINSENLLLIDKTIYNNDFDCPYLSGGNNIYYTNEDQRIIETTSKGILKNLLTNLGLIKEN